MPTIESVNSKANAGLATGIIGTALGSGILGGNGILGNGLFGRNGVGDAAMGAVMGAAIPCISNANRPFCNEDHNVSRYDLKTQMDYENRLQDKDLEIAVLKAKEISNENDIAVYKQIKSEMNTMEAGLSCRIGALEKEMADQRVYNGVNTATQGCMQRQIDQLMSLTALRIPNTSVCPGWGEVRVTPVAPTVTATT